MHTQALSIRDDGEGTLPAETVSRETENLKRAVTRATPRMPGIRLRFPQDVEGRWIAIHGDEKVTLPFGTRLIADIGRIYQGWIHWNGKGERPTYKVFRSISDETPVERHELGERDKTKWQIGLSGKKRDPWEPCVWLPLWSDGVLYNFQTTTETGVPQLTEKLLQDVHYANRWPRELPIVELQREFFPNQFGGRTVKPWLKISGWAGRGELPEVTGDIVSPRPRRRRRLQAMTPNAPCWRGWWRAADMPLPPSAKDEAATDTTTLTSLAAHTAARRSKPSARRSPAPRLERATIPSTPPPSV